jgi:hypothetical protein
LATSLLPWLWPLWGLNAIRKKASFIAHGK